MADFRQVSAGFLADPRLRAESDSVQATYAHIATGRHLTLEGTGQLPAGYLAVDRGRDVAEVERDLERLADLGLLVRDPATEWTFVPAMFRERKTPNHQKAAAASIGAIPAGPVRDAAIAHAQRVAPAVVALVGIESQTDGIESHSYGNGSQPDAYATRPDQTQTRPHTDEEEEARPPAAHSLNDEQIDELFGHWADSCRSGSDVVLTQRRLINVRSRASRDRFTVDQLREAIDGAALAIRRQELEHEHRETEFARIFVDSQHVDAWIAYNRDDDWLALADALQDAEDVAHATHDPPIFPPLDDDNPFTDVPTAAPVETAA